ncbi:carcinoembryonic antigen-related cell adhesion molecule 5-like [Silurus meridionalis]|uniref:carcinoembryonic antigen-related cell adhesion molecule 5-like n=1 Tax=Silurus meridionalis TaxID=175797 RepID=UPI001EEC0382|nr:carcinoembryonic antigen-related cell adhesion molecule 5-like [Silurus meridionalis]
MLVCLYVQLSRYLLSVSDSSHTPQLRFSSEAPLGLYSRTITMLISLIPVARVQGSHKAVVSMKPDTHVFIGETVTLRCEIQNGRDIPKIYSWYKNKNRLTDPTEQTFTIQTVRDSDSGYYTCGESSLFQSSDTSEAVTMTVSAKPKPTVRVNPQSSVYTGDTITLSCELQSTGWEIQWHKNNQQLQPQNSEQANTLNMTVINAEETEYKCRARRRNYRLYYTEFSDPVKVTARERPQAVLSVSPQNWLTEGDSVTLSCEVTDSSTDWTFSWYTVVPYRDGLTEGQINHGYIMYVELLSDSTRGSGGNHTLSPSALHHTGVYVCRGERGEPVMHTLYSNSQPLWISGESPPVSLIISPSRTQHFTRDSLSLSCEDQSISTGWTVRRYTDSEGVLDCSQWGSVTGSTCNISFLSTNYTGVYWCESKSGENSSRVNITVHDGGVILESSVHPVTEGHPLTLHCLYRNTNPSKLRADFYKDGSVVQNQTTGEMIIHKVSKSDEGFYHCKHPERGESPRSWISVRYLDSKFSVETGVVVGLSLVFVFIVLLILMILLWCCKMKKEKQQKSSQTSEQNQRRSGAEDSQSGHKPLQTGEAAAQSSEVTYTQVMKKKKTNRKNGADAQLDNNDVTYAEVQLKPMKKAKRAQEKTRVDDDTVYSELHHNMKLPSHLHISHYILLGLPYEPCVCLH